MANVSLRLDTEFTPVIKLATAHHILVVHPSVPAASLPQFVTLLKTQPDKLTFSSGGYGTPAHLAGELFKLQTGVRALHVPTARWREPSPISSTERTNSNSSRRYQCSTSSRLASCTHSP